MSTIGFIGLGVMGSPMAVHLVRAGHDVTGYDVVPKGVDALVAARAKGYGSLDHSALLKVVEDLSGRPARPASGPAAA